MKIKTTMRYHYISSVLHTEPLHTELINKKWIGKGRVIGIPPAAASENVNLYSHFGQQSSVT